MFFFALDYLLLPFGPRDPHVNDTWIIEVVSLTGRPLGLSVTFGTNISTSPEWKNTAKEIQSETLVSICGPKCKLLLNNKSSSMLLAAGWCWLKSHLQCLLETAG